MKVVDMRLYSLLVSTLFLLPMSAFALSASDLSEVEGYTVIAVTNVSGEFNGSEYGRRVKLDNSMVFEFTSYSYTYSYHPDAVVFAKKYTLEEIKHLLPDSKITKGFVTYKLLIDDDFYDVNRLR